MIRLLSCLLVLVPLAVSAYSLTLQGLVGTPQCGPHSNAWSTSNTVYIPKQNASTVWQYIGDFENLNWQGTTNITVSGLRNQPNNTHTFSTPFGNATEELAIYAGPSRTMASDQTLFFMQFSLVTNFTNLGGVQADSAQSVLLAQQHKNGTKIAWDIQGCSTNSSSAAAAVFNEFHASYFNSTKYHFRGTNKRDV